VQLLLHLQQALGFGLLEAVSGMPVIFETVSAITSSSTTPPDSRLLDARATRAGSLPSSCRA
jgi:hypothetical protein